MQILPTLESNKASGFPNLPINYVIISYSDKFVDGYYSCFPRKEAEKSIVGAPAEW